MPKDPRRCSGTKPSTFQIPQHLPRENRSSRRLRAAPLPQRPRGPSTRPAACQGGGCSWLCVGPAQPRTERAAGNLAVSSPLTPVRRGTWKD